MIEPLLNFIFSPIMGFNPSISIAIICSIVTTILTFVNKKTMGTSNAKEMKQKMEKVRAEMLEAQKSGDKDRMDKKMTKMMEMNSEYLQSMIKPLTISLGISMLLIILFFPWMKLVYNGQVVLTIPEVIPIIGGNGLTWIWWYVICSLVIGIVLRKILGM